MIKFLIIAIFMCTKLFAMEPEEFTQEDYKEYCAIQCYFKLCLEQEIIVKQNHNKLPAKVEGGTVHRGFLHDDTRAILATKWGSCDFKVIRTPFDVFRPLQIKINQKTLSQKSTNSWPVITRIDNYNITEAQWDSNELSDENFANRIKQWIALKKKYADERIKLKMLCINFIKKNLNTYNFDLNKLPEELKKEFPTNTSWMRCIIL